jgi:hypothetical protein
VVAEGLSVTAANTLLDALAAGYTWVKLHVGAPGSAGTANAATETTRKQATWSSAASAAITTTGALSWTSVAGTEDYTHFSAWSASTNGVFGFSGTVTANAVVIGDTLNIPIGDLDVSLPTAS